jgi:hypothetical protein
MLSAGHADAADGTNLSAEREGEVMAEMDYQLLADREARTGSREYQLAASIVTAAERCGFLPDGDVFSIRCAQRKEFLGRVVEILGMDQLNDGDNRERAKE